MPAKDRQFWFRVKVPDESLMFERVDVEAEGLYSKMRRDAFRGKPRGFLVDFRGAPLSFEDMADGYRMTNGRFKARLSELHERGIIQTATEFEASLRALRSAWATKKVSAFIDLLSSVQGASDDVYVIPAMLDDVLDALVGSRTGETGWEEDLYGKHHRRKQTDTPLGPPLGPPNRGPQSSRRRGPQGARLLLQSQSQKLQPESKPSSDSSERERAFTARASEEPDEKPMTWRQYSVTAFKISGWQKTLPPMLSEADFDARFDAEFQLGPWSVWTDIKRRMEASIPAPCKDGHHIFDGDYCVYCPFIRAGETA